MRRINSSKISLVAAMCIFSTIGLLRRYIPLSSGTVALARAVIGTVFLCFIMLLKKQKLDLQVVRKNALLLLFSGFALGLNWMLLFEAYNHTTVATATLCYYMAPILLILVSPFLFREKMNLRKWLCCGAAFIGIILVSGITQAGFSLQADSKGIAFGLTAALFYACVVALNKKMQGLSPLSRTLLQLAISSVVLLPYTLLAEDLSAVVAMEPLGLTLLTVAGVVHTGIAYALYFDAVGTLSAHTSAPLSYIDPILAVILSAVFLQEQMGIEVIVGGALILGAAAVSEWRTHN